MSALLLYCRPGFEKECLAEVTHQASEKGLFGWSKLEMNAGFVIFETQTPDAIYKMTPDFVFTREAWPIYSRLNNLDPKDRLTPIVTAVVELKKTLGINKFGNVSCEFAEGDEYRATSRFSGKFVHPVRQTLRKSGMLTAKEDASKPTLRLFFKESSDVCVGVDSPSYRAVWPMGIARLKFPLSAPSRSTLKLEEAFQTFLGPDWREVLDDCHTGVDLGASPGGWTWQLVNQKMYVHAVDNGPMDEKLMATGLVEHLLEDGFIWKPKRMVDWLVCDMVEKPARVAHLMYEWLHNRHAKYAIFNLKLPMKKRLQQWLDIKEMLDARIQEEHPKAIFKAAHLYHDREEITVYLDLRNQNG